MFLMLLGSERNVASDLSVKQGLALEKALCLTALEELLVPYCLSWMTQFFGFWQDAEEHLEINICIHE
jgi:hypothetical protein